MVIQSIWDASAQTPQSARRTCAPVCRLPRSRLAPGRSIRKFKSWSDDWRGAVCWSTTCSDREATKISSSSNRRLPTIGRQRPSSTTPTFSSCHGLRTCDGAATRWCWNRHAPARCSKFAIRRSRAPSPHCPPHNKSNSCVGGRAFRGSSFSPCWSIAKSCSRSTLPASAASAPTEGDHNLVLWDFHDLLFHTRSTEGRQANPLGGLYPYADVMPPPPAVRPRWRGKKIDLREVADKYSEAASPVAKLLHERHSTRSFDDRNPISLAELSRFLDNTARVQSRWNSTVDLGDARPLVEYAVRPYPSAGASYELELYLAVDKCEGLARGFYHYDAGGHALVSIGARTQQLEALLTAAKFAMDAPAAPQILITIAARFGRISWKYSSIAYALILKDVGVLTANFLHDGDRHGARRMRNRKHQYRAVREDDRDLNSTSRARSVNLRLVAARHRRFRFDLTLHRRIQRSLGSATNQPSLTRTIAGPARWNDRAMRCARNIR